MRELPRTGRRGPEIREFFEGMETYMQKHPPVKVPGPRQTQRVVGRKAKGRLPTVRATNRTVTRRSLGE